MKFGSLRHRKKILRELKYTNDLQFFEFVCILLKI